MGVDLLAAYCRMTFGKEEKLQAHVEEQQLKCIVRVRSEKCVEKRQYTNKPDLRPDYVGRSVSFSSIIEHTTRALLGILSI